MWFLDLSYDTLGLFLMILFFSVMYAAFHSEYLKPCLAAGAGCLVGVFVLLFLSFITYAKLGDYHPSDLHEGYYTFGDTWCALNEYEGELCKSYIHYALDNKALVETKRSQRDEERRQDELIRKAHETKLRANFEKIIAERGKNERG